jgi:hypothetical protein
MAPRHQWAKNKTRERPRQGKNVALHNFFHGAWRGRMVKHHGGDDELATLLDPTGDTICEEKLIKYIN